MITVLDTIIFGSSNIQSTCGWLYGSTVSTCDFVVIFYDRLILGYGSDVCLMKINVWFT